MAEKIAASLPPLFLTLAGEFWPGPLTLVVKAKPCFRLDAGPGGSLAMRVPAALWLQELVRHLGVPITATSANISGQRGDLRPEEVMRIFRGRAISSSTAVATPGGLPSTIVGFDFGKAAHSPRRRRPDRPSAKISISITHSFPLCGGKKRRGPGTAAATMKVLKTGSKPFANLFY